MRGAMLFSNVNGVALSDERFLADLRGCQRRGRRALHHPAHPVNVDMMQEYWLMPLVGFLFDTTLAASSIVFSGVAERFPRIRWALCHLGGAIPYLAERLDRGFHAFRDCRAHIDRPPSTYLKEFYYDTVNFNQGRLEARDRVRLARSHPRRQRLSASDRQHPSMLEAIDQLAGVRHRARGHPLAQRGAPARPRGACAMTADGEGSGREGRMAKADDSTPSFFLRGVRLSRTYATARAGNAARAAVRQRSRDESGRASSRRTPSRRCIVTIAIDR
jgi:hypothetical protein